MTEKLEKRQFDCYGGPAYSSFPLNLNHLSSPHFFHPFFSLSSFSVFFFPALCMCPPSQCVSVGPAHSNLFCLNAPNGHTHTHSFSHPLAHFHRHHDTHFFLFILCCSLPFPLSISLSLSDTNEHLLTWISTHIHTRAEQRQVYIHKNIYTHTGCLSCQQLAPGVCPSAGVFVYSLI